MPKAASKGRRREQELVKLCERAGLQANRVPGSGGYGLRSNGSQHDVLICVPGRDRSLEVEVKARKDGQGFTQLNNWLGNADMLALVEDGNRGRPVRFMAYLDMNMLLELLMEADQAGYDRAIEGYKELMRASPQ